MSKRKQAPWDRIGRGIDRLVSRTVRGSRGSAPPPRVAMAVLEAAEPYGAAETSDPSATADEPEPEDARVDGDQGSDPGAMEMSALDPTARLKLDDQDVKLVPYSIVSVKRGFERYIWGASIVVVEPMTQESFVAWVISKLYKDIASGMAQPQFPPMPDEGRYLRVDFAVTHRWPRESLDFEVKQLRRLEGIYACLAGEALDAAMDLATAKTAKPVKAALPATKTTPTQSDDGWLARAVLGELALREASAPTLDELAKNLEAAPAQLQGILDGLVQAGLVSSLYGRYRLADRGPARASSSTTDQNFS